MPRAFVNIGLCLALVIATVALSTVSGSAPSASAASSTCTSGWWKWEGNSNQLRRFVPNTTSGWNCQLQEGDHNWGVVALQNMLAKCYNENIATDGRFGPATRQALVKAQIRANAERGQRIDVDGIYGPETRDWLLWPFYEARYEGNLDAPHFCNII